MVVRVRQLPELAAGAMLVAWFADKPFEPAIGELARGNARFTYISVFAATPTR
jgi:DNA-directed RNA polymerase subunit K/omega